jgi:hypothetical protein
MTLSRAVQKVQAGCEFCHKLPVKSKKLHNSSKEQLFCA